MTSHALHHYPAAGELPRWVLVGFIAGALSVLVFHQGVLALLYAFELAPRAPYAMAPTAPFGIPALWSIVFWGGIWGALLAASLGRLDGVRLVAAAVLFGALLPTLAALFLVAPLKGQPVVTGIVPLVILIGGLVNGAWGLGTGIGLALFGRAHVDRRQA
ncbi:MAG: hypothetical protein ACREUN_12985 [Burkholderiales bacterium]